MAGAAVAGTVAEALRSAADALTAAGVDTPRLDAALLLAEATGISRTALATGPEAGVDAAAARRFGAMVRRRVAREPVAYILGRRGFRRLELRSDARALIPRPETELLVEVALELGPARVLDVGTGSGAIALAVADELNGVEVVGVDTSPAALELARGNAAVLGLEGRVSFELGRLPRPGHFDLVLANLPYVKEGDWASLAPEIVRFEPREALVGGADGLDPIRGLLAALSPRRWLNPGRSATEIQPSAGEGVTCGAVALELGEGQAGSVADLVAAAGFVEIEARRDLAGIERVVVGHGESAA